VQPDNGKQRNDARRGRGEGVRLEAGVRGGEEKRGPISDKANLSAKIILPPLSASQPRRFSTETRVLPLSSPPSESCHLILLSKGEGVTGYGARSRRLTDIRLPDLIERRDSRASSVAIVNQRGQEHPLADASVSALPASAG